MKLKKGLSLVLHNLKTPGIYYSLLILVSCSTSANKMTIKKVSPYFVYTTFNDYDKNATYKSKAFQFTLDLNNGKDKYALDSILKFIRSEYKKEFDTIRPVLLFTFFKYEKGKIDEDFIESATDRSIFTIGTVLYSFEWHEGSFTYIKKYDNRNHMTLLDSLGTKITPPSMEVIEK